MSANQTTTNLVRSLQQHTAGYEQSGEHNDRLWREFTALTDSIMFLREHRDWVEQFNWGFGDRAFHYMWYLLLTEDTLRRPDPTLLEVGVFKGQVVSLWALIAARTKRRLTIYAISPFQATQSRLPQVLHQVMLRLSSKYREHANSGNQYKGLKSEEHLTCVQKIFAKFELDINCVRFLRGFSQEERVKAPIVNRTFDLIYIDAGHRYEEVSHDIRFYGAKVKMGGYLVLDDASYYQPGTAFWKGHESVSRAAEELDRSLFRNVLNIGHNRVYQKVG